MYNRIAILLIVFFILYMVCFPITCDGMEKRFSSVSGVGLQFEGSLSDLEDVRMFLGGVGGSVYRLRSNKFMASLDGEILGGYRINGSNGFMVALQPIVVLSYDIPHNLSPYIKLIVGVSYNNMKIEGMGMDFNFVTSGGAGMMWSGWDAMSLMFEYRIMHLSNAGLSEQNEGLNMHCLMIGRRF